MKKSCYTFALVLFSLSTALTAQEYESPIEYLSAMFEHYHDINKEQWDYTKAVARGKKARTIEKKRVDLADAILEAQNAVRKMPAYDGNSELRDSVSSYLELSFNIINNDYAQIIDLEQVAEQSYDNMEAYLLAKELVNVKQEKALVNLNATEEKFADKYNINLTKDETKLGKKLNNANQVFEYYNDVYLLFFKSHKQENYYMEALSRSDLAAMEQNRNAIKAHTAEDLEKLRVLDNYKGDGSLKQSCIRLLRFLEKEADRDFATFNDFMLKKDNFEKIKEAFEAKKKSERTKKDIDEYNSALTKYNNSIDGFNQTNERLNQQREQAYEKWNESVESFLDKHI